MRYEAPAIEARFEVRAELGNGQISGLVQPAWRSSSHRSEKTDVRYEAPAIETRFDVRAELGNGQISGLVQPAWRSSSHRSEED